MIRLGEILVLQSLITQEQLMVALEDQKRTGRRLGRVFIENGLVSEDQLCGALAKQLNIPYIDLKHYNFNLNAVRLLPETQARRFRAMVLEERGKTLLVGMADPTNLFAYDEISRFLKRDIDLAVVNESQLLQAIDGIYRRTGEITGFARELEADLEEGGADFTLTESSPGLEDAPVVKLLQSVFEDAVQVRASDIHVEPQETRLQIRFRIDGMLHLQTEADIRIAPALALRLKLMSGLDISEKRLPQDGRFDVTVKQQQVDVRISTMPTQFGESVVMRLLNQSGGTLALGQLGMPPAMLEKFRSVIHRPNGLVLVTGPTGSGKTTTLYAALTELNVLQKKLITVEDPVEYRLPGVNQVQVNEKIDLTFSRVLRSALRQDPDVVLVGEMRDFETAQIGMRAAMTGHLVLSTCTPTTPSARRYACWTWGCRATWWPPPCRWCWPSAWCGWCAKAAWSRIASGPRNGHGSGPPWAMGLTTMRTCTAAAVPIATAPATWGAPGSTRCWRCPGRWWMRPAAKTRPISSGSPAPSWRMAPWARTRRNWRRREGARWPRRCASAMNSKTESL